MSKHINNSGFSAVEALLVLIVLGIIGFTGWFVLKAKHNTDMSYANASNSASSTVTKTKGAPKAQSSTDAYAGWKSYTLPVEKLSFKYPASWTIDAAGTGAPTKTQDQVAINAGDGFTFTVLDGVSNGGDSTPEATKAAIPIKYLGRSVYLVFGYARSADGPGYSNTLISGGGLQTNPNDQHSLLTDKTAVGPNDTTGAADAKYMAISLAFKPSITLAQAQTSPDVKSFELIVQSMHY